MPSSSGASKEKKLSTTALRAERLFSPQYSRMAQSTSSKMHLKFFLFSSKRNPPFSEIAPKCS